MSDPMEYLGQINFNTLKYPQYTHLIETCPSEHEKEKLIRICRCWQSRKFPYCDDTHKVLVENGDSVGPYVAKLMSYKMSEEQKLKQQKLNEKYMKLDGYAGSRNENQNKRILLNPIEQYSKNKSIFTNSSFLFRKKSNFLIVSAILFTSALWFVQKEKMNNVNTAVIEMGN